jgi:hypothetical protein
MGQVKHVYVQDSANWLPVWNHRETVEKERSKLFPPQGVFKHGHFTLIYHTFLNDLYMHMYQHTHTHTHTHTHIQDHKYYLKCFHNELRCYLVCAHQEREIHLKHMYIPKDRLTLIIVVFALNKKQNVLSANCSPGS